MLVDERNYVFLEMLSSKQIGMWQVAFYRKKTIVFNITEKFLDLMVKRFILYFLTLHLSLSVENRSFMTGLKVTPNNH
jgi:hypothetical protein